MAGSADCLGADGLALDMIRLASMDGGAGVAQLAERDPSKVDVAGSNPVSRSTPFALDADGTLRASPDGAERRQEDLVTDRPGVTTRA